MSVNHRIAISMGLGAAVLAAIPVIAQQRAPTSGPIAQITKANAVIPIAPHNRRLVMMENNVLSIIVRFLAAIG